MILKISLRAKAGVPKTLVKQKNCLHSMYFPQNTLMLTESRGKFSDLHSILRLRALRYFLNKAMHHFLSRKVCSKNSLLAKDNARALEVDFWNNKPLDGEETRDRFRRSIMNTSSFVETVQILPIIIQSLLISQS